MSMCLCTRVQLVDHESQKRLMDSPGNYSLCGVGDENRKRSRIYSLLPSHLPSPIFILKSENNSLVYNSSSWRGGFKIPHSCCSCFRLGSSNSWIQICLVTIAV